ncbi:unnamed protein product [Rotaria sordida]|uniref:NHL repeat-containing protein 2 n=2 Tax=Rotaria sordida TaxID=392033 RepID=A0A814I2J0_9BILA|nr:unnamed protein product [Rotaria sordida]
MKWVEGAKEGVVVAGGQGEGNGLTQLSYPEGVVVDELGTVYVADRVNDRIMRWTKGATQGSVIVGGNGREGQSNQLNRPFASGGRTLEDDRTLASYDGIKDGSALWMVIFPNVSCEKYRVLVLIDTTNDERKIIDLDIFFYDTVAQRINTSDQCQYISEVLNETIVNFHLLRRMKYYHLPCQRKQSSLHHL